LPVVVGLPALVEPVRHITQEKGKRKKKNGKKGGGTGEKGRERKKGEGRKKGEREGSDYQRRSCACRAGLNLCSCTFGFGLVLTVR